MKYDKEALKGINIALICNDLGISFTQNRNGKLWGLCPFHAERTPSFSVNVSGKNANTCHCYGCGAHLDTIGLYQQIKRVEYLEACQALGEKYLNGAIFQSYQPPMVAYQKAAKDIDFVNVEHLQNSLLMQHKNNFFLHLLFRFDELELANHCHQVFTDFKVGTAHKLAEISGVKEFSNCVIFWQIDQYQRVRTGKVMNYDTCTGKRQNISENKKIAWVHNYLGLPNFELEQCLFGEHLIHDNRYKNKPIALVESAKTAIIMNVIKPNYLWLAVDSLGGLQEWKLEPIKGKQIILYPDLSPIETQGSKQGGTFKKWQYLAERLKEKGFNMVMSTLLEDNATDHQRQEKLDIADFCFVPSDEIKVKQLTAKNGNIQLLINLFQCKIKSYGIQ